MARTYSKKPTLAERSYQIEQANLKHILPTFGKRLVTDIEGKDISQYQQHRLKENASPKTINLEVGTLRAILRRNPAMGCDSAGRAYAAHAR